MSTPLLSVQDLFLYYRAGKRPVHAVDGVSFTIEERAMRSESWANPGPAKRPWPPPLMRMLPKNVELFRGSIQLDGRELTTLSNDVFNREIRWKRIAMVFQGAMNVLNPVVRVGEQIAETLIHDGMDKKPRSPVPRSSWSESGSRRASLPAIRMSSRAGNASASSSPPRW
ncbi:MAG: hypothetical protein R2848_15165 [Thermomicrobiales bacterium]